MEALGVLGFLTFLVAAPWMGIALLRKKNAKTPAIVACVAFVVFIIGAALSPGTDPSEGNSSVSEEPSQAASSATQEPREPATITQIATPTSVAEPTTQEPRATVTSAPTTSPTPVSEPAPPSVPLDLTLHLSVLLEEYEANKVLADTKFRYLENGKHPIIVSGYVEEVERLYVKIVPENEQYYFGPSLDCYYRDLNEAILLSKGQAVTITGRVSGVEFRDVQMFMCDVHEAVTEDRPTLSANDVNNNVVQVFCRRESLFRDDFQGTGVMMGGESNLILTAHHVVDLDNECTSIEVRLPQTGSVAPASLVRHCASVDQAYLRLEHEITGTTSPQLLLAAGAPAQIDQEVYLWAWGSAGLRWQSGVVEAVWGVEDLHTTLDAFVVSGDSGSPVFNEFGHLLGVLSRGNSSDRATYYAWNCGTP